MHKKAYASYKAFQFLKHGVKTRKKEEPKLSQSKQRLIDNDPYNFPELNTTLKSVLSDSVKTAQLNDYGEPLTKPGRRYRDYNQEEYIESLFGRDMARAATTDVLDDKMWQA